MTLFLTRMSLNPARRGTAELLASPQRLHAAAAGSFPPGLTQHTEDGRLLWRVDAHGRDRTLLMLSVERPDLTAVVERAGWPTTQAWESRTYDGMLARVQQGQIWGFRLTGNPVHYAETPTRGVRRLPHQTETQMLGWLQRKGELGGFSLVSSEGVVQTRVSEVQDRSFTRGRSDKKVQLRTARFDGALHVEDADLFRYSLAHGVGSAKGYGCGLLTLARLP